MNLHYRISARIHVMNLGLKNPLEFTLEGDRVRIAPNIGDGESKSYLLGVVETIEVCSPEMIPLLEESAGAESVETSDRNENVLAFYRPLNARLWIRLEAVVSALRWRCGVCDGPRSPFSDSTYEFSVDGTTWRRVPNYLASIGLKFSRGRHNVTDADIQSGIADLLTRGKGEPLGYQLLREALELEDNPP